MWILIFLIYNYLIYINKKDDCNDIKFDCIFYIYNILVKIIKVLKKCVKFL